MNYFEVKYFDNSNYFEFGARLPDPAPMQELDTQIEDGEREKLRLEREFDDARKELVARIPAE